MADLEHLSLFSEWDASTQENYVKNFPARGERTSEQVALERLALEGWKLTSIAPTRVQRAHGVPSHVLNFERSQVSTRQTAADRGLRIVTRRGEVKTVPGHSWSGVGHEATIADGVRLGFLGVSRLKAGAPDLSLLGSEHFPYDRDGAFTGLISIKGHEGRDEQGSVNDLYCQFLYRGVDDNYSDDVHTPERLDLRDSGLIVGMPFGTAELEPRVPLRSSRFEYLIFTGDAELGRASEILVRFQFTIAPR